MGWVPVEGSGNGREQENKVQISGGIYPSCPHFGANKIELLGHLDFRAWTQDSYDK